MKASDLRIGNLVYNVLKEVITVDSIRDAGVNGYSIETIKLIPLTEERLLKFGFEGHDYTCPENGTLFKNDTFTLVIDDFSKIVIQSDFSFGIAELHGEEDVAFSNDILDSVHRLQNLYFALTGEELKLKEND